MDALIAAHILDGHQSAARGRQPTQVKTLTQVCTCNVCMMRRWTPPHRQPHPGRAPERRPAPDSQRRCRRRCLWHLLQKKAMHPSALVPCLAVGLVVVAGGVLQGQQVSPTPMPHSLSQYPADAVGAVDSRCQDKPQQEILIAVRRDVSMLPQGWPLEALQKYVYWVRSSCAPVLQPAAEQLLMRYYQLQRRLADRLKARTTIRMLESLLRLAQVPFVPIAVHVLLCLCMCSCVRRQGNCECCCGECSGFPADGRKLRGAAVIRKPVHLSIRCNVGSSCAKACMVSRATGRRDGKTWSVLVLTADFIDLYSGAHAADGAAAGDGAGRPRGGGHCGVHHAAVLRAVLPAGTLSTPVA